MYIVPLGGNEVHYMNEQELLERIALLEYHQHLLLKMINHPNLNLYKLIIEHGISEEETGKFFKICDKLSKEMAGQKAEGFIYFHPLFQKLASSLPGNLTMKEIIHACISQGLYVPLMQEFKKYI